jgi:hypothetical protein
MQLIRDSNVISLKHFQKQVCLVMDEIHLKESLVYDKYTDELVGFSDIGDINQHLLQVEQQYKNKLSDTSLLANSILVIMIRGLFTDMAFPYASFPSVNLTGDQLVPIFYEAVMRIERCGLQVIGCTMDGHSINRKLIKLLGITNSYNVKHYTKNPMDATRNIYFFSDPPHLIKTTRNCFESSKRNMEV